MILNLEELWTPLRAEGALQGDLDRLESWVIASCMKFSKSTYRILHPGQSNTGYTHKLSDERYERRSIEREKRN